MKKIIYSIGIFLFPFLTFGQLCNSFYQLGQDIIGQGEDDSIGFSKSVSLSGDGNIMAVGSMNNDINGNNAGHVRIYEWNGSTWLQKGVDIDGEAEGDYSGISVSLSSDGSIVAIGAYNNYENG